MCGHLFAKEHDQKMDNTRWTAIFGCGMTLLVIVWEALLHNVFDVLLESPVVCHECWWSCVIHTWPFGGVIVILW